MWDCRNWKPETGDRIKNNPHASRRDEMIIAQSLKWRKNQYTFITAKEDEFIRYLKKLLKILKDCQNRHQIPVAILPVHFCE